MNDGGWNKGTDGSVCTENYILVMILFLDFDGVLHPEFCHQDEQLFCHRNKLETILRDYQQVEIVVPALGIDALVERKLRHKLSQ